MKVSNEDKQELMDRLWFITEACYTGVEVPKESFFRQVVREGDVFVALDFDGMVVAYALLTPDYFPGPRKPLLRSIAVLPDYRKRGLGRFLLDEIATYYTGQASHGILLHCKVGNPAQKLYFDAGYRVRAYLRNYYAPEGDGLEMEKVL